MQGVRSSGSQSIYFPQSHTRQSSLADGLKGAVVATLTLSGGKQLQARAGDALGRAAEPLS